MGKEDIDIRQLLPTGTLLQGGKYRVERYLSSGNFGNTYIVQNTGMQVQFAMKEFFLRNICYRTGQGAAVSISPAVDPDKVGVQREKFKKEAQRLYGLKSRHLVHVHDMFEENGTVYYVMDFVKGESLARYMERTGQPLSEQQVRYILDQLLDGLEEIHQKQIWHLDLKPDNIMIDSEGNVVIIDFGASKQVGRSGKYTGTSNILCYTPGYAPKEQVNQNMEAIGPWTDIYAVGATLYNLLTRIEPSTQHSDQLVYPVAVSAGMRRLIGQMMATDLTLRPQGVAQLRQLMASVGSGTGGDTAKGAARRGKWMAVAAAVAVVVVAVVAFALAGGKSKEQNEVEAAAQEAVENVQEQVEEASEEVAEADEAAEAADPSAAYVADQQPVQQKAQPQQKPAQQTPVQSAPQPSASSAQLSVTACGVTFTMVRVAGGTFTMGATPEQGSDAFDSEKPAHSVTLSDYYIGETEVTQALWEAVMGTTVSQQRDKANREWPLRGVGANYPMYYISWEECQDFVRELNRQTGRQFRLPTEAEWEYAARGGSKTTHAKYAGSDAIDRVAWYDGNSGSTTHPVKTKAPNELGLYDMSGNVWEWCQDWYGSYSSGAQTNPTGAASGSYRVHRGGSWNYVARYCRVSYRGGSTPGDRSHALGLRLAL